MFKVAQLSADERNDLFSETANEMGVSPAVTEKDFWVCLVLHVLFTSDLKGKMVFKGGTSLSKVFGAIRRFSEDIDLVLDWTLLGYDSSEDEKDLWLQRGRDKQQTLNKDANNKASEYIKNEFIPVLNGLFKKHLPEIDGLYAELDPEDVHTVRVFYPKAFDIAYIKPEIKLEIGPLASWTPQGEYVITTYAEEHYPIQQFDEEVRVTAIKAERTFWEKCTILHQEANRPESKLFPARYSRHYYDVYMMCQDECGIKKCALKDKEILSDVVKFKQKFYHSAWAKYDEATLSQLKLVIPSYNAAALRKDYDEMKEMLFGVFPSFEEIMECIEKLEAEIHTLA